MLLQQEEEYSKDGNFYAVEDTYLKNIEYIVQSLWSLSDELLFKYASGFVNEPEEEKMSQMVGYPEWWLKAVGYEDGPPPPPTKPKCCHPSKPHENSTVDGSGNPTVEHTTSGSMHPLDGHGDLTGKAAMKKHLRAIEEDKTATSS
jgi:hypothetical protein